MEYAIITTKTGFKDRNEAVYNWLTILFIIHRRIMIGEYNAIIYGEFVPLLVGNDLASKHFLLPGSEGAGAKFIPEVTPGILTSHAFASYRNPAVS